MTKKTSTHFLLTVASICSKWTRNVSTSVTYNILDLVIQLGVIQLLHEQEEGGGGQYKLESPRLVM